VAIFKRGNLYWYAFIFNGVRIRESKKQRNRLEARKIEAARKTQLSKAEVGIKEMKKVPAFVDFQERFLAGVSSECAANSKTVQFYHDRVKQLLKYPPFKSAKLDEIDLQFVADYISYRRGTKRTRAGSPK